MLSKCVDKHWDVIIIGAGLGGGTVGRKLAENGLSVLFVERGPALPNSPAPVESFMKHASLNATIDGVDRDIPSAIGIGVGGSSSLYAATLERPERHDIDHSTQRTHPTGGWPENYDTYLPYFAEVERQFHVCGSKDPLSHEADDEDLLPPPSIETSQQHLLEQMQGRGLNPYRIHLALNPNSTRDPASAGESAVQCRMDGRTAGVEPALETGNAALLDECRVKRLKGTKQRVTSIVVERGGRTFELHADRFVLAGGSFGSPQLLLASASEQWPNGCANSSGLVGSNLMFHLTEWFAVWPRLGSRFQKMVRSIGLRDFYYDSGNRYGLVQDSGLNASYGILLQHAKVKFDRSRLRRLRPLRLATRLVVLAKVVFQGEPRIYACVVEDLPYQTNRVVYDEKNPDSNRFEYDVREELTRRRFNLRQMLKSKWQGGVLLTDDLTLNYPHACGTLRFGNDPATSVLNRDCRAHDVENLYVADASFMPTSMGVNPGLMIAANALRVADRMLASMAGTYGHRMEPALVS